MQPLPRVTVVKISTGEKLEAAIIQDRVETYLYWPQHLRRDGQPNSLYVADGVLMDASRPSLIHYALYDEVKDAVREAKAAVVRQAIRDLVREKEKEEQRLLAIYLSPEDS